MARVKRGVTAHKRHKRLLKDAEGYAKKGVESMRLSTYLREQLAGYEKRKQKPPSPEELQYNRRGMARQ